VGTAVLAWASVDVETRDAGDSLGLEPQVGELDQLPGGTGGERDVSEDPELDLRQEALEVDVAKRERDTYRPGAPDWVKTKNRATARFAQESARSRRGRTLIEIS
jgi:hypothetical protein